MSAKVLFPVLPEQFQLCLCNFWIPVSGMPLRDGVPVLEPFLPDSALVFNSTICIRILSDTFQFDIIQFLSGTFLHIQHVHYILIKLGSDLIGNCV